VRELGTVGTGVRYLMSCSEKGSITTYTVAPYQVMRPQDYFAEHPVFRVEDFQRVHADEGGRSRQTTASLLKQHVAAGNLVRPRRGLYATVPRGVAAADLVVDGFLLAARHAPDAVLAYHAALQLHGRVYTPWSRYHVLSAGRSRRWTWRGVEVVPVLLSKALRIRSDQGGGVQKRRHAGGTVRVTTLERSMVDVLHRPDLSGGWEEIWRSLELVEFFDLDLVITHAERLGSAVTAARVGFYLEQHREQLMVEEHHLVALQKLAPSGPRYLDPSQEQGQWYERWKLVVPERVVTRSWGEVP
jgi:predicted transcriptional regulator of viral defense system